MTSCRFAPAELLNVGARLLTAVLVLMSASVLLSPVVHAGHDGTCHPESTGGWYTTVPTITLSSSDPVGGDLSALDVEARISPSGKMTVRGTAQIIDGTSKTVLVSESVPRTSATCADTDDEGGPAIASLDISFRLERSGDRVLATVTPHDGPIQFSGRYVVTATFHRFGSHEVLLDVDFRERPGR